MFTVIIFLLFQIRSPFLGPRFELLGSVFVVLSASDLILIILIAEFSNSNVKVMNN